MVYQEGVDLTLTRAVYSTDMLVDPNRQDREAGYSGKTCQVTVGRRFAGTVA